MPKVRRHRHRPCQARPLLPFAHRRCSFILIVFVDLSSQLSTVADPFFFI